MGNVVVMQYQYVFQLAIGNPPLSSYIHIIFKNVNYYFVKYKGI